MRSIHVPGLQGHEPVISDESKSPNFSRTYGGDEWRQAIKLPERERRACLLETYKGLLRTRADVGYVSTFAMFDKSGCLLYWLVFCTNNLRGLEEMKKAMWKVDNTGSFRFSDKDNPDQMRLLKDAYDQDWLAGELALKLAGRDLTIAQVKEFVLTETPCYLFKPALKILESNKQPGIDVTAPSGRRRGTFPDRHCEQILLRFHRAKGY
jgi:hypothetical protein